MRSLYYSSRTCPHCGHVKPEHEFAYSSACSHVFCQTCITQQQNASPVYFVRCMVCDKLLPPFYLSVQRCVGDTDDDRFCIRDWRPVYTRPPLLKIRSSDMRLSVFRKVRDDLTRFFGLDDDRLKLLGFVHRRLLQRYLATRAFYWFMGREPKYAGTAIGDRDEFFRRFEAYMARYPYIWRLFDPFMWLSSSSSTRTLLEVERVSCAEQL